MNDEFIEAIRKPDTISEEYQDLLKSIWDKNIEAIVKDKQVILNNISEENINIILENIPDEAIIKTGDKEVVLKGDNIELLKEQLVKLVLQDTLRFKSAESYVEERRGNYGEPDDEDLHTIALKARDLLKKDGKEGLYIPEEDRVYDDGIFLKWHKRYLDSYYKKNPKGETMSNKSLNELLGSTKRKYDVTVFGGCSLDQMYYQQEDFTYSDEPQSYVPGGKGANQAIAAARAGATVNMISRVGNDKIGEGIIENLELNGVNTTDVEMLDGVPNDATKVYINRTDGGNEMHRMSGAINSFTEDMVDTYAEDLLSSRVVVAQMKINKDISVKLINFCYDNFIPIIITPCRPEKLSLNGDPGNAKLIDKISFITCNRDECETIFGTEDVEACVTKYPNKLIVTLGPDGVMYHDGTQVVHINAINIDNVIDTVGAGDTFNGNLAAALTHGYNLKEAIYRAQFASAMKLGRKTAQKGMPYKDQLDTYIDAYEHGKKVVWKPLEDEKEYTFDENAISQKTI